MRIVIYSRVSTEEQAKEGYSLASQQERAIKFIESQDNWTLVDNYIDDGKSAKDLKRPEMQRLIEDAKLKKFDVVVFYKLDRLVRSVRDLHELLQLFDKNDVKIRSVTEIFDTTSALGRFFLTLVAAMAEWERETISERVLENMGKKAKGGERNGAKPPFGYKVVNSKLEVVEEEAAIVKEMFRLYSKGNGLGSIVKFLQGFNLQKSTRTIGRMLDNPVYCGKVRWGNNSNKIDTIIVDSEEIPAIISEETFLEVQKQREKNTKEGKKATSPYHFSGVLRCARCGSALSGQFKKQRGTKHYICIAKKNSRNCDLPIFTETALSTEFIKKLVIDNVDDLNKLIKTDNKELKSNQNDNLIISNIEKELSQIKIMKRNWMLALGEGVMSHEDYSFMMSEVLEKEKLFIEQLNDLTNNKSTHDPSQIIELVKNIPDLWSVASDMEKKGFIYDLFKEITVDVPRDYQRGRGNSPSVEIKNFKLR